MIHVAHVGERINCEQCMARVATGHDNHLYIRAGKQVVITERPAQITCPNCGHLNILAILSGDS